MEQGFIDILQKLVDEQGKGALTDARKFKALINDYTRDEYKKESRFVVQAVEVGAAKAIEEARDLAACKKAQARELEEEFGLSPAVAADIVNTLALVLRGKTTATAVPPPTTASPPSTAPVAAPAGTPITKDKGMNKLIRIAAIVAIGLWFIYFAVMLYFYIQYDPSLYSFVDPLSSFEVFLEYLMNPLIFLAIMPIPIVLSFLGWKKNNRILVLIAAIIYIYPVMFGIPSGIMCIIAFRKMKKPVG